MTRWEQLEDYIYRQFDETGGIRFTSREYAESEGLDPEEASRRLQAYLSAQRTRPSSREGKRRGRPAPQTLFVLYRDPGTRTSSAVWLGGVRTQNARQLGVSFTDDVKQRVLIAMRPDLLRIADRNPRAARHVERQIVATLDHALPIMEMAAQGLGIEE